LAANHIDTAKARMMVADACGEHACFAQAWTAGADIRSARDLVVELCMPFAPRMVRKLVVLPSMSRCEYDDLEAAALFGLVEGVDSYEHARPVQIHTHIYYRMWKRIAQERSQSHWRIMRPPQLMVDKFMSGRMSEEEADRYAATFLAYGPQTDETSPDDETHDEW
jgi:hypothetical protein